MPLASRRPPLPSPVRPYHRPLPLCGAAASAEPLSRLGQTRLVLTNAYQEIGCPQRSRQRHPVAVEAVEGEDGSVAEPAAEGGFQHEVVADRPAAGCNQPSTATAEAE